MAILVIQPKKGKKLTYKDFAPQIKHHNNGIIETVELGELIIKTWDVAEAITPQERIEADGSRKYYVPMMLEWSAQFTNKELMEQIRNRNIQFYYDDALKLMAEKVEKGEFIPAKED